MPLLLSALAPILLPWLAQVGPFPQGGAGPGAGPVSPLPREILDRQSTPRPAARAKPAIVPATFDSCLALAAKDAAAAADSARTWQAAASGAERSEASHCLGLALSRAGKWDEAQAAFAAAIADTPAVERELRARRGAMAGNAALAAGRPEEALTALDTAVGDAETAGDMRLTGEVEVARARALVLLGRIEEALPALDRARSAIPGDAEVWLLSATLSRRLGRLALAQEQIVKAGELLPIDPAIGLEAGVIAMLAGREAAARLSWQSVIAAAPASEAAATAQGYLAQIGP